MKKAFPTPPINLSEKLNNHYMKWSAVFAVGIVVLLLFSGGGYTGNILERGNENLLQPHHFMEHWKNITVHFSPPRIMDGEKAAIEVAECNSMLEEGGKPVLPEYNIILTFPAGTRITKIECFTGEIKTMKMDKKPFVASLPVSMETGKEIKMGNEVAEYPDGWFSYRLGAGLNDGKHVIFLPLHLYPVRVVYEKNEIEYVDSISVKIGYEIHPSPLINESIYDLIIISPSEFKDALQPLMEHKERHGVKTKIVTLDEIYNGKYFNATGRDDAEKIKYFLKNAIENWGIKYVLLAGDIWHVPSRIVYSFWGSNRMHSDYYYADIYDANMSFCSWDSNGNNRFGEVGDNADKVDLYADLYVGRLACGSVDEVNTVVNKIINYEDNAYGSQWFHRLVLMGGDTFPKWNDIAEGEVVNEYVANVMQGFEPVKIQTSLHNFLPNKINQILSQGAGFVCFSGHGFEYGFGTYPKNKRWMIAYYTPYLLWLKNGDKLPIIFFDACLTAKLDYHMFGNPNIPCFAWCMVKKPDGGAIATIGATETATTTVDADGPKGQAGYLDLHFFMAYKPGIHVSEMLVKAKHDYLNDISSGEANDRLYKMTIEQFILLGDPSLKVGGYE